jgi:hypothetical protein
MSRTKYLFASILFSLSLSAFSQTKDTTIFLKWKLKPNEVLSYKTVMEEIDTANHKDFSTDSLSKLIGGKGDKAHDEDFKKVVKQLNAEMQNSDFITHLTEKRKGIIDIELFVEKKDVKPTKNKKEGNGEIGAMQSMIAKMSEGIMLRGSIYDDGTIESFYTKNDQKNLLAMMFELPGKPVKPGDKWPLSIHFISMDQNFICDSSYKRNEVTLVSVENKAGEHIVNLKYDIAEYVMGNFISPFDKNAMKTSMKMTYRGMAGFSLEKGKWVVYDGVMFLSSTGFMSTQTTKKFSLIAE